MTLYSGNIEAFERAIRSMDEFQQHEPVYDLMEQIELIEAVQEGFTTM